MFEVKEKYRSKGYGTMLCKKAEEYLRSRGAECLYTDTPDDPDDRRAWVLYSLWLYACWLPPLRKRKKRHATNLFV